MITTHFKQLLLALFVLSCGFPLLGQKPPASTARIGTGDTPASRHVRVLSKPDPVIPVELSPNAKIKITLRAVFTKDKQVKDLKFISVDPKDTPESTVESLTKSAKAAASKIKFEPGTKDGKLVSVVMQLEYVFKVPN